MKELAEEEPHLVEQFQKLSEAAGRVGLWGGRGGGTPWGWDPSVGWESLCPAGKPRRGLGHPCETGILCVGVQF